MSTIIGTPIASGGGMRNKYSTLPPPITNLTAKNADGAVTVSFDAVPDEYEQYLSDKVAYIVVIKEGSVPEHPYDGQNVKLAKDGTVVE